MAELLRRIMARPVVPIGFALARLGERVAKKRFDRGAKRIAQAEHMHPADPRRHVIYDNGIKDLDVAAKLRPMVEALNYGCQMLKDQRE